MGDLEGHDFHGNQWTQNGGTREGKSANAAGKVSQGDYARENQFTSAFSGSGEKYAIGKGERVDATPVTASPNVPLGSEPWRSAGLYTAPGASYGKLPPSGKILAAYTDAAGYTVRITGGTPRGQDMGGLRVGVMRTYDPQGANVHSGYWLGIAEKTWSAQGRDYAKLSWEQKASLQVEHQAKAYDTLKSQMAFHLGWR